QVQLRWKRRPLPLIRESSLGQLGLLKIGPSGRERVEKNEQEKPEQVTRFANVRHTLPKFTTDRLLRRGGLFARSRIVPSKLSRKEAHRFRCDFEHPGADQEQNAG